MSSTAVKLPDQNQLYARFMYLCGQHGVVKPSKAMLQLLEEDEASRQTRLQRYADAMHTTSAAAAKDEPTVDTDEKRLLRSQMIPLAQLRCVKIGLPTCKVHLGSRNVLVLLDLLEDCPLLESLDLSGIESLYAADPYRRAPSGNDVVRRLCQLLLVHPSLNSVNLRGHPVATTAATWLLDAVERNPRLREVQLEPEGVDYRVMAQLANALQRNSKRQLPPPTLPTALSEAILSLQYVDRKTAQHRQQLRLILKEREAFADCSPEELDEMVSQAESETLDSVVNSTLGLRGDGEHAFLIVSGSLEVFLSSIPFTIRRGVFFGEPSESVLFSGGRLVVKERGHAFRIPLACMGPCLRRWADRVETYYGHWKHVAALQSVPVWMLIQACYTVAVKQCTAGEVLTPRQSPFAGLFFPLTGRFAVLQQDEEDSKQRAPLTTSYGQVFTVGDVFGEEAVMTHARRRLYTNAIVAIPAGQYLTVEDATLAQPTTNNGGVSKPATVSKLKVATSAKEHAAVQAAEARVIKEQPTCLHVSAESAALMVDSLRTILQVVNKA